LVEMHERPPNLMAASFNRNLGPLRQLAL